MSKKSKSEVPPQGAYSARRIPQAVLVLHKLVNPTTGKIVYNSLAGVEAVLSLCGFKKYSEKPYYIGKMITYKGDEVGELGSLYARLKTHGDPIRKTDGKRRTANFVLMLARDPSHVDKEFFKVDLTGYINETKPHQHFTKAEADTWAELCHHDFEATALTDVHVTQ